MLGNICIKYVLYPIMYDVSPLFNWVLLCLILVMFQIFQLTALVLVVRGLATPGKKI